jgi:hypothetical protein
MKVALLQDFFDNELIGGAEKNDAVLLKRLKEKKINIKGVHTYKIDNLIEEYDYFIVSNFIRLSNFAKNYLIQKKNYVIYEHDHKYLSNRNPGAFNNFKAPNSTIINRDFYASAQKVFVLSKACKEVIEKNLEIDNAHNIACSLWSKKDLDIIKHISLTSGKSNKYGILDSSNIIKGTKQALQYCSKNNIEPYKISSPDYVEFITKLSLCENFIFFPQVLETFSRVCAEAKMLNCNVLTTPKLIGFFSEEYSSMSGIELNEKISDNVDKAILAFRETILH